VDRRNEPGTAHGQLAGAKIHPADHLVALALKLSIRAFDVSGSQMWKPRFGLRPRRLLHSKWIEDMAAHIILERHSRDLLHEQRLHIDGGAIPPLRPWVVHQRQG